jgi:hypothetical protein
MVEWCVLHISTDARSISHLTSWQLLPIALEIIMQIPELSPCRTSEIPAQVGNHAWILSQIMMICADNGLTKRTPWNTL